MLDGLPVLDLTDHRGEVGPWLLAELGADVIKVEPPGGSPSRRRLPLHGDESLQFAAYNSSKRTVELDPAVDADRATLLGLLADAAIVFESGPPGALVADHGLDRAAIIAANRRIVQVVVTAFGPDGPRGGDAESELTIAALGGPMSLQGTPERAPLAVSVPQVWRHVGAEAAIASLVALRRRDQTGEAQFVDLSAQAAMTWTMLNAMEAHEVQGYEFDRLGATIKLSMKVPLRRRCADGYVILVPRALNGARLAEWMIADGLVPGAWRDEDWSTWDHRIIGGEPTIVTHADLIDAMDRLCAPYTKQELLDRGRDIGVTIAPLNDVNDLLAFEHLEARNFWQPLEGGGARVPGSFVTVDGRRLTESRSAPKPDPAPAFVRPGRPLADEPPGSNGSLPFDGINIADFSWIGVGPITAKCLADHGATVVRVESGNRLDGLRGQPPFKDGERGLNRSNFFGTFNTSKRSLALDLKTPGGIDAARRLVEWADVVIDSFTPGAMTRLGLGPDEIRAVNPEVITVTTSLLGGGGPYSSMAGYGYHAAAIAGFFGLVGWPDLPPDGPWLAYTDTIGPRFITPTILAALDRRRRTGEGCHIEAGQLEIALQLLAPELLDLQLNGAVAIRRGNRTPEHAPQGVYRCGPGSGATDADWVAISVTDDEAWARFRAALGDPSWAAAEALAHLDGRQAVHDELDRSIETWTSQRTAAEVESVLRAAGVAAGRVQRSRELACDQQYDHRRFYRRLEHDEVGVVPYAGHQYRIEGYDHGPRWAAPTLGGDTFDVLTDLLGMDIDTVADIAATGALE